MPDYTNLATVVAWGLTTLAAVKLPDTRRFVAAVIGNPRCSFGSRISTSGPDFSTTVVFVDGTSTNHCIQRQGGVASAAGVLGILDVGTCL